MDTQLKQAMVASTVTVDGMMFLEELNEKPHDIGWEELEVIMQKVWLAETKKMRPLETAD